MEKFERLHGLHQILAKSRYPVARKILEEKLDCSPATINRMITESRDYLDAPIEYDNKLNGYYYDRKTNEHYELPGLWFNASELHALLAAYQLLSHVQPGFLEPHIAPLKNRIEEILTKENYTKKDIFTRIRILQIAARDYNQKNFAMVATALLGDKQLHLHYHGRTRDETSQRTVSPQRIIHYRDNWYLDAWCHERDALRSFALDCIRQTKLIDKVAKRVSDDKLNQHYGDAYGIFSGKATHTAVLRFTAEAARWVSKEQWHPRQSGQFELNGSYTLEVPYSDTRELIMDIMKYGANVEVMSPASLRSDVIKQLQRAAGQYT